MAVLDAAGGALAASTYLGGSDHDWGLGIAVGGAGAAVVTGWTESPDFPQTPTTTSGAAPNAFVARLAPSGGGAPAYDEAYAYDQLGNLTSTAGVAYTYPAAGQPRPHAPTSVGGQAYGYDANGNLTGGGGRTYIWDANNQPTSIAGAGGTETYAYDADGKRVKRTAGGTTTVYAGGLWEAEYLAGVQGATRAHYACGGRVVAQRERQGGVGVGTVLYLHGDHLGSVSVATDAAGAVASRQEFDPWGKARSGDIPQTTLDYTGQQKDGTGLLFYNARYYDPAVGRFVSADTIVPGMASSKGGGAATLATPLGADAVGRMAQGRRPGAATDAAGGNGGAGAPTGCGCAATPVGHDAGVELRPLTVGFHAPGFAATLQEEHAVTRDKGFWFQLEEEDRKEAKWGWGPRNPQALNRYAYVLNNPLRYTDPTGHEYYFERGPWWFTTRGVVLEPWETEQLGRALQYPANFGQILALIIAFFHPLAGLAAGIAMVLLEVGANIIEDAGKSGYSLVIECHTSGTLCWAWFGT